MVFGWRVKTERAVVDQQKMDRQRMYLLVRNLDESPLLRGLRPGQR